MFPLTPTTRNLFDSLRVYVIPNYQRAYVWNKDDQWEPLWLDILGRLNASQHGLSSHATTQPKPHFLGAAVFKEITIHGHDLRRFVVVDGQQRITTLQILLTALADVFHSYDGTLSALEASVRSLTINWHSGTIYELQPDKVKPLAGDFLPFTELMSNSRSAATTQQTSASVIRCYHYFLTTIGAWLRQEMISGEELETRARALFTAIADDLQMVAIFLDVGENESAIFEALNARGEPLSEWEKTKNYILFKAGERSSDEQMALYDQYLEEFDEPAWRKEIQSGQGLRRISDVFLDYWLESQLCRPVDARRVFRECRVELNRVEGTTALEAWCQRLQSDGQHFLRWETREEWDGDLETLCHSRRRALGIGAVWPLLFALHRADMTQGDRWRCLRVFDSYLWRRTIAGRQNRGYPDMTLECLRSLPQVPEGETPYSDALIERLLAFTGNLAWPSDGDIRIAIKQRQIRHTRVVLEALERAMMRGHRPGQEWLSRNLPIEHIMPRTRDDDDWPLPEDAGDDAELVRSQVIHRLGNLTLVDHGLNSVLGNRPWHEKRSILQDEDNLYVNKELLNNAPAEYWYENQIDDRADRLADYILRIWPHGPRCNGPNRTRPDAITSI